MKIVGIDPGLSGAVAVIDGEEIKFFDAPTVKIGTKNTFCVSEMVSILLNQKPCKVFIERVHAMPGQGVTSMFSMGYGLGLWEGILASLGIPYTYITPQAWKKSLMDGMPKDKGASIVRAQQLFPGVELKRKKDHGMADALLIAEYGRRYL